ncbi:MAG: hypothetical protein WEA10_06170 [Actinomycetota bacterium]
MRTVAEQRRRERLQTAAVLIGLAWVIYVVGMGNTAFSEMHSGHPCDENLLRGFDNCGDRWLWITVLTVSALVLVILIAGVGFLAHSSADARYAALVFCAMALPIAAWIWILASPPPVAVQPKVAALAWLGPVAAMIAHPLLRVWQRLVAAVVLCLPALATWSIGPTVL